MLTLSDNKNKEKRYKTVRNRHFVAACVSVFYLSACGGGGGSDDTPVQRPPVVNQPPEAVISVDQSSGIAPFRVDFSGSSSSDSDGTISSYSWDFTSDNNPDATTEASSFTYETAGIYTASLTVTDNDGATASAMVDITVERAPEKMAFIGVDSDASNGFNELYLAIDDGSELTTLATPGASHRITDFKFSPDGQWIAYRDKRLSTSLDENIFVVSVNGGMLPLRLNQSIGADQQVVQSDFRWSPDSSQIVYTINSGSGFVNEVWLVNRDGTARTKVSGTLGNQSLIEVRWPRWSPDGKFIFQHVRNLDSGRITAINIYDTSLGSVNSTRLFTTENITGLGNPGNVSPRVCYVITSSPAELRVSDASEPPPNSVLLKAGLNSGRCQWNYDDSRVLMSTSDASDIFTRMIQAFNPDNLESPITFAIYNILDDIDVDTASVTWRPNSSDEISYLSINKIPQKKEVVYVDSDGTNYNVSQASDSNTSNVTQHSWSPNGDLIAYLRFLEQVNGSSLFIAYPDGSSTIELGNALISNEFIETYAWSQDSSRLALSGSDRSDPSKPVPVLFFITADGTEKFALDITDLANINQLSYQPQL